MMDYQKFLLSVVYVVLLAKASEQYPIFLKIIHILLIKIDN
jgi:hypothetical protein